jgi:DNA-binding transcriptional LysR family regulator
MNNARLRRYFRHGMFPQLIAFEACIRHGSVTRAAHELSLAQPTVSCLIKKLSDTLGGPLTVSRDRRIEPTPLGVELLALCQELFDAFESFDTRRTPACGTPSDSGGESANHGARGPAEL